jgi:hypothetical protein
MVENYDTNHFKVEVKRGKHIITKTGKQDRFDNLLTNKITQTCAIKLTIIENPNTYNYNCFLVGIHEKIFFSPEGHIYNNKGLYLSDGKTTYKEPSQYVSTECYFNTNDEFVIIHFDLKKKKLNFIDKKQVRSEHDISKMDLNNLHFSFLVWYPGTSFSIEVHNLHKI